MKHTAIILLLLAAAGCRMEATETRADRIERLRAASARSAAYADSVFYDAATGEVRGYDAETHAPKPLDPSFPIVTSNYPATPDSSRSKYSAVPNSSPTERTRP